MWQLQLQTTLLRAVQSRVPIIDAQCLHALYAVPGTVATVRFIGTSETKEIPHNNETRLDGRYAMNSLGDIGSDTTMR